MKIENIKFKAKRLDNGEWIVGSLIISTAGVKERAYIVDNFSSMSDYSVVSIDPSTVCQFTGLKDCEGKELFEHDLIHFVGHKHIGEVTWSEENYAFMVVSGNEPLYWLSEVLEIGKIERVGNKFDRKEGEK